MKPLAHFFLLVSLLIVQPAVSIGGVTGNSNVTLTSSGNSSSSQLLTSPNVIQYSSVGQSSPLGIISNSNFILKSGMLYGHLFNQDFNSAIPNVMKELIRIQGSGSLSKKESSKLKNAIKELDKAFDSYTKYQNGTTKELKDVLERVKNFINKVEDIHGEDTESSIKMMLLSSELEVTVAINNRELILGKTDSSIVKARTDLSQGIDKLYAGNYEKAIKAFQEAFKKTLKKGDRNEENESHHENDQKHENDKHN
ncbi:MAG: hypothetical protein HQK84_03890 [Nitrospinae bacterium]|nr:hypothetical protein [Nitrospinota bacterium]